MLSLVKATTTNATSQRSNSRSFTSATKEKEEVEGPQRKHEDATKAQPSSSKMTSSKMTSNKKPSSTSLEDENEQQAEVRPRSSRLIDDPESGHPKKMPQSSQRISNGGEQSHQLAASLRSAANEGKVELVRLLLKCGADVNAQDDEFGNTPLHQAAWNGFSAIIQVLCKHRASTSIKNKAQFTPLHLACQQGHNQSARLLLMASAKSELKNSYGDTPLHTAARYGHAGVARILLSAKCNPNLVNKNNDTPLHIAAAMGRRKLTKILMQHGAELVIKNKQNETAMDIALRKNLIEIQELIANPPPKTSSRHHQHERHCDESRSKSHHHRQHERHHHHKHHNHHHHHQQQHQQQLERAQKSMLNLISIDDNLAQLKRRNHELSISSQNVPAANQPFCSQLYGASATRLPDKTAAGLQHQRDQTSTRPKQRLRSASQELKRYCNVSSSSKPLLTRLESESPSAARRRESTPVDAVMPSLQERPRARPTSTRTLTLTAGLGVSAAALDELMGRRRAATPPPSNRQRPSSVQPECSHHNQDAERKLLELTKQAQPAARLRPRSSPNGSMRSSHVGGSRSRPARGLVLRPRRLTLATTSVSQSSSARNAMETKEAKAPGPSKRQRSASALLLGGKLSLLQLRQMVNRRAAKRAASSQQRADSSEPVNESSPEKCHQDQTEAGDNQRKRKNEKKEDQPDDGPLQPAAGAAGGRRCEREQALNAIPTTTGARCLMRAPNGTKLLTTRPLAALDDDTQLYAIPRKNSKIAAANQQQQERAVKQQVADEAATAPAAGDAAGARQAATGTSGSQANNKPEHREQRDTPNGPALTASDSGPSIASDSSLASSSDECIESLNVVPPSRSVSTSHHLEADQEDEHDFCAPGYSVVKERPGRHTTTLLVKARGEPTDECSCPLASSHSEREHEAHQEQDDASNKLIRPKSVLSSASAELLAAQKSLAAAAAAKVHRDRLAKLARSHQETQSLDLEPQANLSHDFRQLSVKTSPPHQTLAWLQHHQHHQTLVAAAAARVVHQQANGGASLHQQNSISKTTLLAQPKAQVALSNLEHQHRSGTNSAGMSDSSPSNNGADSDNSIQTHQTSTTETSVTMTPQHSGEAVAAPATKLLNGDKQSTKREQSGPFGILSRILLNNSNSSSSSFKSHNGANSSGGPGPTANGLKKTNRIKETNSNKSSSSTGNFNGSLSSSSALSSPSISTNGRSPNSTSDSAATATATSTNNGQPQLSSSPLDQSRSRRPIVLTRSNELPNGQQQQRQDKPNVPPRLPPKGVLKQTFNGESSSLQAKQLGQLVADPNALINGLPRVPSSSSMLHCGNGNGNGGGGLMTSEQHLQDLCNYHALNRSHHHFNAMGLGAKSSYLTPYLPAHSDLHVAPHQQPHGQPNYLDHHAYSHMGGLHLNSSSSGSTITQGHYGPLLDSSSSSIQNASMVCHCPPEDSIYIPPSALSLRPDHQRLYNETAEQQALYVAYNGSQRQQQYGRPTSILECNLGPNGLAAADQSPGSAGSTTDTHAGGPSAQSPNPGQTHHQSNASHAITQQNSIYAPGNASGLQQTSELTVLPTSSATKTTPGFRSLVQVNRPTQIKGDRGRHNEEPPVLPSKKSVVLLNCNHNNHNDKAEAEYLGATVL